MWDRLRSFINPFDERYEDMTKANWLQVAWRDTSAGLIVAMMAIPLAMGFAMASGLRPEHGIVAGAVAGLVGALFGGSKYNVYGPVAALIPVIAGIMTAYATPDDPFAGHGFLVLICVCSGPILMVVALLGWGKIGNYLPHSIVVGFSVGIAVTIGLSQMGEVLGFMGYKLSPDAVVKLQADGVPEATLQKLQPLVEQRFLGKTEFHQAAAQLLTTEELASHGRPIDAAAKISMGASFIAKVGTVVRYVGDVSWRTVLLAALTFLITKMLLKVSIYIPAPLFAIGFCMVLAQTLLDVGQMRLVKTEFGAIPTDLLVFSPPSLPAWNGQVLRDLVFYAFAFAFVCGFESLLAARMADRLADNNGSQYNPDREFWGQGLIQSFVPLLNGMPLSGALARTATNIKVGAVTPLAGIMKCFLKLALAFFMASYLEVVPMACIGGILLWVAVNMVKPTEIKQVFAHNWFHVGLMTYTGVMVVFTSFLTGVLSAMAIYAVLFRFFDAPPAGHGHNEPTSVEAQSVPGDNSAVVGAAGPSATPFSESQRTTN